MDEIKTSVVIVTYNPSWEKLKRTIDSILIQKKVTFEIVISDDGSKDNLKETILKYFGDIKFHNYLFLGKVANQGTVLNCIDGIEAASYPWIKLISPGDMLFDDNALFNWISFAQKNDAGLSFGRSIFYTDKGKILSLPEYPKLKNVFMPVSYSRKEAFLDYVFLKDVPNGASFICKKNIYLKYLYMIRDKIKFSEDTIYRIALANGEQIVYHYSPVIWYEHGDGISTGGNKKWESIISNERIKCNEIIGKGNEEFEIVDFRMKKALRFLEKTDWLKYFYVPELIFLKMKKQLLNSFTLYNKTLEIELKKMM